MITNEDIKHYRLSIEQLNISIEDIEKLAHIEHGMPSYTHFLTSEIARLNKIAEPEGGYVILPAKVTDDTIIANNKVFNAGNQVTNFLKNMEYAAIFVCTAGKEVTNRAKHTTDRGDLVEGYLLDVLGSVIVEKAMDKIQQFLLDEMNKKGLRISNRYSPGYCEWNVKEQKQLFSFFPENFCKVSLSDSCLMAPVKSVSGIIAIGKDVRFHKHVCHACSSLNCLYRNTRAEK